MRFKERSQPQSIQVQVEQQMVMEKQQQSIQQI
jgi:hypothetical protein